MEFDTDRPIWLQLVEEFTRRIVTGQWPCKEKIPGVRELASEVKVNPNTVQRALAELERRGLAKSERAVGRFVTGDEEVVHEARLALVTTAAEMYVQRVYGLGISLASARELVTRRWPIAKGVS